MLNKMNWLTLGALFVLTWSSNVSLAFSKTSGAAIVINTTDTENSKSGIPFSVDADEVLGATKVVSGNKSFAVQQNGVLAIKLPTAFFEIAYLLGKDGAIVAMDVVAEGVKETLTFNAANSAKADVVLALTYTGLSYGEIMQVYEEIHKHPKFLELTKLYREAKSVPLTDTARNMERMIAVDLYEKVRSKSGSGL